MILTVTPNPALDITWHASSVQPGETHRVPAGVARAGGKGLNVARVLHAQGVSTVAMTQLGGAVGAEFAAELSASGIPNIVRDAAGGTRRSIAIVDESAGSVSVFNEFGAELSGADAIGFWNAVQHEAQRADVVTICGSMPPGDSTAMLGDVVRGLIAHGNAVLVDTSGAVMLDVARAGATVLKPNRDELHDATGESDPVAGAKHLLELGATAVVASLGEEGLFIVHRDGRGVQARFNRVVHGNATGAGDAVSAAIAVSLASDPALAAMDALEQLAKRAAAWGAAAVASPLAGDIDLTIAASTDDVQISQLKESR